MTNKKKVKIKKKMGRPIKKINFSEFEKLCGLQCTLVEIAEWFKVSVDTVERRVKKHYSMTFADIYKKYSALGKISLRRKQYEIAIQGNVTMLIWLGKQWLNQKDKIEGSGNLGNPIVVVCQSDIKNKWPKPDTSK